MSKLFLTIFMVLFLSGGVFLAAQNANAGVTGTDFGLGPGCSAIEGVDATTLVGSGGTCDKTSGLCDDTTTACTVDSPDCDTIGTGLCNGVCSDDASACTAGSGCFDGAIDFPDDPECTDFSDDDESS